MSSFAKRKGRSLHSVFSSIEKKQLELEISEEGKEMLSRLLSDLSSSLTQAKKDSVGRVLYDFLKRTGYLTRLEKSGGVESESKIQNISRFFEKIRQFTDVTNNESVKAFIDWLEIMKAAGDDPATGEYDPDLPAVNVMTIHAAKGLEFKAVFMVNLVSDLFPTRQRKEAIPLPDELVKETLPSGDFHLQEERRLFYVGMTRARGKLYFTWSKDMGGKRVKKVSPFVLEALDKPIVDFAVQSLSPIEKISLFALSETVITQKNRVEPRILKLSQATIDDYLTCAYKYRYIHILRLPILRHHAVTYGSALHEAVGAYYRARMAGKKFSLEEMIQVFENAWETEGFLSAEHEVQRLRQGKKVLGEFWRRENTKKELPTFIEKEFRLALGDVAVVGRFDRVDIQEGKINVIDFKSTESRTQEEVEKAAKDSLQLKIYGLAFLKMEKKVPDLLGIYDLDSGFIAGYKPSRELLEKTEEEIIEVSKNLRESTRENDFPANPKYFGRVPACHYCAYSSICPFSQAK
jgi:DNA helicase-2/ATP-dependent DNA helicase PcrA